MKINKKQILLIVFFTLCIILAGTGNSKAVLQSNARTHGAKKSDLGTNWIVNIRKMEATNGGMGLGEQIKAINASDTTQKDALIATSESNGIDVHMMKTTEYGAVAILYASGYGNPEKISSNTALKTSTGNKTGVYFNSAMEWTAGGGDGSSSYQKQIDGRYVNRYTTNQNSKKIGDALVTCNNWHNVSGTKGYCNIWLDNASSGFRRGEGGVFSYSGRNNYNDGGYTHGFPNYNGFLARGVAVCGAGL